MPSDVLAESLATEQFAMGAPLRLGAYHPGEFSGDWRYYVAVGRLF